MPLDGRETIARWREAGEWWSGAPQREFLRTINEQGVFREVSSELPSLGVLLAEAKEAPPEDHTEECGYARRSRYGDLQLADGFYESYKAREVRRDGLAYHGRATHRDSNGVSRELSPFAPLHLFSGYAFGSGTMHAAELPALCVERGFGAGAIADPLSLVGAVEFVRAAQRCGVKPLVGASVEMEEGGEIVLIARSKRGYESLSGLITACHLEEPRLHPLCNWNRLERFSAGLLALTGGDIGPINPLLTQRRDEEALQMLRRLCGLYGSENVFVEIERSFLPWEISVNQRLLAMAEVLGLVSVAGGAIGIRNREEYPAQDVLTCTQTLCTVDEVIGRKPSRHPDQPQKPERPDRWLNAERYFRNADEIEALFSDHPELIANTRRVVDRCDDEVLPGRTRLPQLYENEPEALRTLTYAGAMERHRSLTPKLRQRLDMELARIARLGYAGQFLVIHDACEWAKGQRILCSGRGSVVDSAVAYCLGLSRIDGFHHGLHFDRFLPDDGSKRPDIDIDFEAKRRDDVRNYLSRTYGEDKVATVSAIGTFGTRGIVREVGKAMGLPEDAIGFLAKRLHDGVTPEGLEAALDRRPELRDSGIPRDRFRWVFKLAEVMADLPRNLRSHSSGVVISSRPLCETVPVMWSGAPVANGGEREFVRIIQWDKRSAKHYFDKFDILCLRGQDVLGGTEDRIQVTSPSFSVEDIALDDPETYRTMRSGQLVGIPQSASPAMRQAHIRLHTNDLHDASLVQAGIRPGVGGAVKINELIARRRGLKPWPFEHPLLERILGKSYGIIVFQEQVDELLQAFCGYTSGEAESIREAIHERRKEDFGSTLVDEIIARATAKGFTPPIARHVFELVAGFKGYGFAQGHALAFAEISVRSIYCQQNFPADYFASLLDAQPAGYYGPATLVNEARTRGVAMLPPCVNRGAERFEVEDVQSDQDPKLVFPRGGIRVSLNQISGLSKPTRRRILSYRNESGWFGSFFDFAHRVRPERDELERLILCGALDALHGNRRAMLWGIAIASTCVPATEGALPLEFEGPPLPDDVEDFSERERAIHERQILGLDVRRHLMAFERERVASKGALLGAEAGRLTHGTKAVVVGHPIRLRFPPTSSGKRVVFFDLEDESGLLNVTCFDDVYQRDGHAIVCNPYVTIRGEAQDRDGHIAFLAHRVFAYKPNLAEDPSQLPLATTDFLAK